MGLATTDPAGICPGANSLTVPSSLDTTKNSTLPDVDIELTLALLDDHKYRSEARSMGRFTALGHGTSKRSSGYEAPTLFKVGIELIRIERHVYIGVLDHVYIVVLDDECFLHGRVLSANDRANLHGPL